VPDAQGRPGGDPDHGCVVGRHRAARARLGRRLGTEGRNAEGRDTDWRQWLAAAASLVLVSGGLWWLGAHLPTASVGQQARVELVPSEFDLTQAAYQSAIEELELVGTADADMPAIAAPALAALRESLADLDDVIGEARDDLALEPDDTLSQEHLLAALDNKVLLLQDTLALLDQTDQGAMP
jgi:hypothetical protein